MKWLKRPRSRPSGTHEQRPAEPRHDRGLADRVRALEEELAASRLAIARLQVEQAAGLSRANAFADLTEQRIDALYRQVVLELKRAFDLGTATIETESAVDARLAKLFSAGLETEIDPAALALAPILSGQLRPGRIQGPLTLYGFRVDRSRARECGDRIEILPMAETGGTAVYGPYKWLAPGRYTITAHLRRETAPGDRASPAGDCAIDIYSPGIGAVLAAKGATGHELAAIREISVAFDWTADCAADVIEIRLHQRSTARLSLTGFTLTRD
jgi:hypothetical protein